MIDELQWLVRNHHGQKNIYIYIYMCVCVKILPLL
jgi:hypothetical protein